MFRSYNSILMKKMMYLMILDGLLMLELVGLICFFFMVVSRFVLFDFYCRKFEIIMSNL